MKTGKQLGRGNPFFNKENRVIESVGMDEYMGIFDARCAVTNMKEEDGILRELAGNYRINRALYESGIVNIGEEICSINN